MDFTSASKGVFVLNKGNKKVKSHKTKPSLFQELVAEDLWYTSFKTNWNIVETQVQELHSRTYSLLLNDIVNYVRTFSCDNHEASSLEGIIPSATLLTGVNQPDHVSQFVALTNKIREEVTEHIAMVHSQDAPTVKHLVENIVWQLIQGNDDMIYDDSMDDSMCRDKVKKCRKSQCTMSKLKNWYQESCSNIKNASPRKKKAISTRKLIVVVLPDFESFSCSVLQDFVTIMSSYVSILPMVFIFGVATSVSALHKSFPYHVSSKLLIKVFHSHSSPVYMNQVLEEIFLSHNSCFHLSAKAFELLTDVFLFYDFSVTGLIQSIKYCMMDHYYGDNIKSLCCKKEYLREAVTRLSAEDIENIRHLLSFRPFLEQQDCRMKIALFENDDVFRKVLFEEMNNLHDYLFSFYSCLRLLSAFIKELPQNVLGKTVRELYTKCARQCITETKAFKDCIQLLDFQSQTKLIDTIKKALKELNMYIKNYTSPALTSIENSITNNSLVTDKNQGESFIKTIRVNLITFLRQIENANSEATVMTEAVDDDMSKIENVPANRYKLKEKLLKATRMDKIQSEFEMIRSRLLSYLEEIFTKGLQPPHSQPFHEIFFFSDVANVKKQIIGSPRGAIHTALSNPEYYLQCSCCHLRTADSVSGTLPSVCIAYKLHRECGRLINLFDWLQAFAALLQPPQDDDDEDERKPIDHVLQSQFTRSVAELQFLGFIKSSKRKTDHVMRLTW